MHPNETVVVLLDAILLEAQSPAVVGGGKAFATEIADRDICILAEKVTAQGVLLGNLRKRQMSPFDKRPSSVSAVREARRGYGTRGRAPLS